MLERHLRVVRQKLHSFRTWNIDHTLSASWFGGNSRFSVLLLASQLMIVEATQQENLRKLGQVIGSFLCKYNGRDGTQPQAHSWTAVVHSADWSFGRRMTVNAGSLWRCKAPIFLLPLTTASPIRRALKLANGGFHSLTYSLWP